MDEIIVGVVVGVILFRLALLVACARMMLSEISRDPVISDTVHVAWDHWGDPVRARVRRYKGGKVTVTPAESSGMGWIDEIRNNEYNPIPLCTWAEFQAKGEG